MSNPLVSVIIPVFNGAEFLAQTLESALAQEQVRLELIIVDDGSEDQSLDIALSYTTKVFRQTNQGPATARNLGISKAKGDYFALLDQDDLWHPEKLALQLQALKEGDYAVCRATATLEPTALSFDTMIRQAYQNGGIAPTPSAFLIPKTIFFRVGLFQPIYRANSDAQWLTRANQLGLRMVYPEKVLLYKRFHHRNQGHDTKTTQQELLQVLRQAVQRRRSS